MHETCFLNCFFMIDLPLLFKLVSRVPNATLELKSIVEDHIRQMGNDAIERVSATAINVNHNPLFIFIPHSSDSFFTIRIQNSMLKPYLKFIQNTSNLYKKLSAVNKVLPLLLTK